MPSHSAERSIARAASRDEGPLSFSQARLWFLDQLVPGATTYNIPLVIDVEGPLDVHVLRQALSEIVRRHDALRTVFPADRGHPRQVVLSPEPLDVPLLDLTSLDPRERDRQVDAIITTESRRPYDLAAGPIFRARVLRLAPQHLLLVAGVHHIVFDGWSNGIFFRELVALCRAYAEGTASPLEEPSTQFLDYAVWQRERIQGDLLDRQMRYWTSHVGAPPALSLPTDFPRPAVQSTDGGRAYLLIPDALIAQLEAFSRREGVTLFITLLTAYGVLLRNFCRQDEMVIGTPIANRPKVELEAVIGFFLNMLPLRLDMGRFPTFREALGRVRRVAFGAYAHQELPFEKLIEELRPERRLDRSAVIETVFVVDNNPHAVGETIVAGDLRIRRRVINSGTAKFDIGLLLFRHDGGRRATLEYRRDLFEATTAARLLRQYEGILRRLVTEPDTAIDQLLRADDDTGASRVLEQRGQRVPFPRYATIAELFEEQARRTPHHPAVASAQSSLSYGELNARANQLAHRLRTEGLAAGSRIGVCLERSAETMVALLAIAKIGAAYVPLDARYPPARLAKMVRMALVDTVVTVSHLAATRGLETTHKLCLDLEQSTLVSQPTVDLASASSGEDLAYVLFTSGTTGEPKMVGVPHRAITRLAYGMPGVPVGDGARVLHAAPLSFDASTFEIWAPLLRGGCVVVSPHDVPTPSQLETIIEEHRVTALWLTASLFNLVIDERPGALRAVGHVLTGGETLSVDHVTRALAALPHTTIVNGYGPTETTTFATFHVVNRHAQYTSSIPIGRPLDNTFVYILDECLHLVGPGVPGAIWIGGDALAVGYLGDPALTQERFHPDPFEGGAARIYMTGDRGQWLPDGTIEFLGRVDDQIKLRGFRIEPAEIEAALVHHPEIRRAAVALHDLPDVGRTLVAHFVAAEQTTPPASADLRAFLHARLPHYMVPALFEPIADLPLLPSGKLDRRALPPPAARSLRAGHPGPRECEAPPEHILGPGTAPNSSRKEHGSHCVLTGTSGSGELELVLAEIWRSALGIPEVDVDDDFFALGGHSLLAIRLAVDIESRLGVTFPLARLFEHGTIRTQAQYLRRADASTPWSPLVAIQPHGDRPPLFLVHAVGGEVLSFRSLARHLGNEQPLYGLQARTHAEGGVWPSVEEMATTYIEAVRRHQPEGPYQIGGYSGGGLIAYEMAQQLHRAGQPVSLLAMLDSAAPGWRHDRRPGFTDWLSWPARTITWLRDDDLLWAGPRAAWGRSRSRLLALIDRVLSHTRNHRADIRHALGVWRYPESSSEFLTCLNTALKTYRPAAYPGSITLFRARSRRLFSLTPPPDLGWGRLVAGRVRTHVVPAAHDTLVAEPRVRHLAEALRRELGAARTAVQPGSVQMQGMLGDS